MWNSESAKNRFINYLLKEKLSFIMAGIILLTSVASDLYIPMLVRNIFDNNNSQQNFILFSVLALIGAYVISNLTKFLYTYVLCRSSNKIIATAQQDSINNLVTIDYKRFTQYNKGQILNRLTHDFQAFEQIIQTIIPSAANGIVYIGIALIILLRMNLILTLCAISVVVFYIAAFLFFNERIGKLYRKTNTYNDEMTENTQDIINGIKDIKLWRNMGRMMKFYIASQKKFYGSILSFKVSASASKQIYELIKGIGIALIIVIGSYYVSKSVLTFGQLFAFVMYSGSIYTPAIDLLDVGHDFNKAISNIERAFELYDEETGTSGAAISELISIQSIEFENVSFAYSDNLVLKDLNMKLSKGSRYALTGETGAGKSTLLNVLSGLYQPISGTIKINGKEIAYNKYQEITLTMKAVLQDSYAFNQTLEENIRLFNDGDISNILDKACLSELNDRMDMHAGQNGSSLSGGQRQRLLLTRIFGESCDILILDECTSALDENTEMQVLKNICNYHKDAIIVFCSHQKAILELVENIMVLEDMKINNITSTEKMAKIG